MIYKSFTLFEEKIKKKSNKLFYVWNSKVFLNSPGFRLLCGGGRLMDHVVTCGHQVNQHTSDSSLTLHEG
jgi:hypothetical protein